MVVVDSIVLMQNLLQYIINWEAVHLGIHFKQLTYVAAIMDAFLTFIFHWLLRYIQCL